MEGSELSQGRLIALLIVEMGLLPSEILQLKIVDIELDFQVLRVGKEGQKTGLAYSGCSSRRVDGFDDGDLFI